MRLLSGLAGEFRPDQWPGPPPLVQSEVVTPIGLLIILPMASLAALTKVKFSSTAEVLEVFHQPLEAIISLRRYVARLIHRTCGARRTSARRVQAQVRARRDLVLDRGIRTNWLLRGG